MNRQQADLPIVFYGLNDLLHSGGLLFLVKGEDGVVVLEHQVGVYTCTLRYRRQPRGVENRFIFIVIAEVEIEGLRIESSFIWWKNAVDDDLVDQQVQQPFIFTVKEVEHTGFDASDQAVEVAASRRQFRPVSHIFQSLLSGLQRDFHG